MSIPGVENMPQTTTKQKTNTAGGMKGRHVEGIRDLPKQIYTTERQSATGPAINNFRSVLNNNTSSYKRLSDLKYDENKKEQHIDDIKYNTKCQVKLSTSARYVERHVVL